MRSISSDWFGHVSMQLGKPQGCAQIDSTTILCLPGNPVSSFVSFHIFVRPVLDVLAGLPTSSSSWNALQVEDHSGLPASGAREKVVPVFLSLTPHPQITAAPFASHFISIVIRTNALARIPADSCPTAVSVIPFHA
ncbi:molybdopterin-binding protein [Corynebacterium diphtheriae]|uniref:molybdopterin-binding protein n=1 Tax=Corynebacterium diphtheriae TaxID=1717 RepID=UPI003BFA3086